MDNAEVIDSKFRLVLLAAKRAKQLLKGAKKKVDLSAENPLTVAMEEIVQGKVDYEIIEQEDFETQENQVENLLSGSEPDNMKENEDEGDDVAEEEDDYGDEEEEDETDDDADEEAESDDEDEEEDNEYEEDEHDDDGDDVDSDGEVEEDDEDR